MEQQHTNRGTGATAARRFWIVAAGLAGLVALGACENGKTAITDGVERPTTSRPVSTTAVAPPSTSPPATPVVGGNTPTTRAPGGGGDSTGEPRVIASPPAAAPGTRVSITGEGFTAENWQAPGASLWLAGGPSACDFYASADHDVQVTADGHLAGSFVVPDHGDCRQSTVSLPIGIGSYRIVYQCTACTIGEFYVTADGALPAVVCEDVGFSPASDNLASDITAYGPSCAEAEAVVREVGGPLGPINGAARGEAGGFTCVRTGQDDIGLPSATYECTRGSHRITFVRT
jgi:hypothetical protein